jgi:hypothetical protein
VLGTIVFDGRASDPQGGFGGISSEGPGLVSPARA